jgi:hypothetical protein
MGKTKGPYVAEFSVGERVRIAPLGELRTFAREWKWHHPLEEGQFAFAAVESRVRNISFYHGGDELYELEDAPGIWHEGCLTAVG